MTNILETGDKLEQSRESAVLTFSGKRKVISTGALNGGLHNDLEAVFNYNDCPRAGAHCKMQGDTMEAHQTYVARSLGLNPETTTGLNTAANIDNAAVEVINSDDFSVTAIVTAGVEVNACRIGEPAKLHEHAGICHMHSGTINIILVVDANMTDACITRALVTATMAKAAALQELMVSSRYSSGLATGSGTDGMIIVSNLESPTLLCEASESFLLGECIGKVVMDALKKALYRQSGLCPGMQHNVFRRLERFGFSLDAIWQRCISEIPGEHSREVFDSQMEKMCADGSTVTLVSLYAHLIDQVQWGLLLPQEALDAGIRLLDLMNMHYSTPTDIKIPGTPFGPDTQQIMIQMFVDTVFNWIRVSQ